MHLSPAEVGHPAAHCRAQLQHADSQNAALAQQLVQLFFRVLRRFLGIFLRVVGRFMFLGFLGFKEGFRVLGF